MSSTPYINPVVYAPLKRVGDTWSIDPELLGEDTSPPGTDYVITFNPSSDTWKYAQIGNLPTSGEHEVTFLAVGTVLEIT